MKIEPVSTKKINITVRKVIPRAMPQRAVLNETKIQWLPLMSLESLVPSRNIVRNAKKEFNVEEAIEKFNDINDTETISKICEHWKHDYIQLSETFSPHNVSKMDIPHIRHAEAIEQINKKYEKFTNKIAEMHSNEEIQERTNQVYAEYIVPINRLSMETYREIDKIPVIKNSYQKIVKFEKPIEGPQTVDIIQNMIMEAEKIKLTNPEEYQRLQEIIHKKLLDL